MPLIIAEPTTSWDETPEAKSAKNNVSIRLVTYFIYLSPISLRQPNTDTRLKCNALIKTQTQCLNGALDRIATSCLQWSFVIVLLDILNGALREFCHAITNTKRLIILYGHFISHINFCLVLAILELV